MGHLFVKKAPGNSKRSQQARSYKNAKEDSGSHVCTSYQLQLQTEMIQQQASLCHHKVPLTIVAAKNLHHILLISQWHNFVFIQVLKTSPYFAIVSSMNNDVPS